MDIYNHLQKHIQKERVSFHMPGHKSGNAYRGTPFSHDLLAFDTTELDGTDCLYAPTDFLLSAQKRAATYYGAKQAHYLVNGSTCGILAMFYACFSEGDRVIIDRNCHKSVVNAMALIGIRPLYVCPDYDENLQITTRVSPEKIEALLKDFPDIKGVFLTSPSYYGYCSDLTKIAQTVHEHGALLLVDEAHGAHFAFAHQFPKGAMGQGADISVMSLHKTLPSPNQTALLLVGSERVDAHSVADAVNVFQTTSPSYILMMYMDLALEYAKSHGQQRTNEVLAMIDDIEKAATDDPFKLILNFSNDSISGYQAEQIFRERFGIYAELADFQNVLLMPSWANSDTDFALLKEAISYMKNQTGTKSEWVSFDLKQESQPALSPKEARAKKSMAVMLADSEGKINKQTIVAFPPCIPILLPGERITSEHITYLQTLLDLNRTVSGLENEMIQVIIDKT